MKAIFDSDIHIGMPQIRVLTEETINQIAAGEVIENPASVVKELVENSIDAGASHIAVHIKGGGFQLIKVADDGWGMDADDALLCFERHATSKLSQLDDLTTLTSMGFRGEALASIASISRIELTTSKSEGTRIEIDAGKIISVQAAPRTVGTTFEIRSLFFNVPARKKFQKKPSTAAVEVHRLLIQLSLAHPEVGFELISNEEKILQLPSTSLEDRIEKLSLSKAIRVQAEQRGYQLRGFLGKPSDHRPNRMGQYLFVNRRPIISPLVSFAVKEGYGERLDEKRFPIFVLHLEVPTDLIDVNVHPQKKEVRFQESDFLREWIRSQVQKNFGATPPPPPLEKSSVHPTWEAPLSFREAPEVTPSFLEEHPIGLFEHYLLLDASTVEGYEPGIVWVDLQKAEQMMIEQRLSHTPAAQGLLLPICVELNSLETKIFLLRQEELTRFGFTLHQGGKQTVLIDGIPPFLDEGDIEEVIRMILHSEEPFPKLSEKVSKFAVRKKKKFTLSEALTLWRNTKHLSSAITWTGMHEIGKLFK